MAFGSVDWIVTVSYGPTTLWLTTCTLLPAAPAFSARSFPAFDSLPHPTPPPPAPLQLGDGPVMTGSVSESSAEKNSSCDSCSVAPACTGRIHAKSEGDPEYSIWSQSTVC